MAGMETVPTAQYMTSGRHASFQALDLEVGRTRQTPGWTEEPWAQRVVEIDRPLVDVGERQVMSSMAVSKLVSK